MCSSKIIFNRVNIASHLLLHSLDIERYERMYGPPLSDNSSHGPVVSASDTTSPGIAGQSRHVATKSGPIKQVGSGHNKYSALGQSMQEGSGQRIQVAAGQSFGKGDGHKTPVNAIVARKSAPRCSQSTISRFSVDRDSVSFSSGNWRQRHPALGMFNLQPPFNTDVMAEGILILSLPRFL